MDANPRGQHFFVRRTTELLSGDRDVVTAVRERIRQVEDMQLFSSDIGRKELSKQKKAHQPSLRQTRVSVDHSTATQAVSHQEWFKPRPLQRFGDLIVVPNGVAQVVT
jgi:hypothetical protein